MMIFFSGILTAIALMIIVVKINPKLTRILLGYDWVVDIFMTIGIIILFAYSGTISGTMIGIIAGLTISITLFLAKRTYGYSKILRQGRHLRIKNYDGVWSAKEFWNDL